MTDSGAPEEFDRPVDEFEAHARIWRAQHRLAKDVAAFCRWAGLDPELSERLHEATVDDASYRGTLEALVAIHTAFGERLEEDPEFAARFRAACERDSSLGETIIDASAHLIQAMANLEALEEQEEEDED
jgi:hypothetical protein